MPLGFISHEWLDTHNDFPDKSNLNFKKPGAEGQLIPGLKNSFVNPCAETTITVTVEFVLIFFVGSAQTTPETIDASLHLTNLTY